MQIEIVYGDREYQNLAVHNVRDNCSVGEAIEQSGFLKQYPELDLADIKVGVFGKKCPLSTMLSPNDRIEIYRLLKIDPKQARRLRANKS